MSSSSRLVKFDQQLAVEVTRAAADFTIGKMSIYDLLFFFFLLFFFGEEMSFLPQYLFSCSKSFVALT